MLQKLITQTFRIAQNKTNPKPKNEPNKISQAASRVLED